VNYTARMEMLENLGALEKGVLIPTCNIKSELAKMSPEEARKAKRKWRKLLRKGKKKYQQSRGVTAPAPSKSQIKKAANHWARHQLRLTGEELLSS